MILETLALVKSAAATIITTKKIYDDLIKKTFIDKRNKSERIEKLSARLNQYLVQEAKKLRSIKTIVHPGRKIDLLRIYTPLTVENQADGRTFKMDDFDIQILRSEKPKVVIDTAGMGKSTLFKYIFLSCIKQDYKIPFLIELRKIGTNQTIEEFIRESISNKKVAFSIEDVNEMLLSGNCVILLDGLDELDSTMIPRIIDNINSMIGDNTNNRILLSTRKIDILNLSDEFEIFKIKTLERNESISLLIRYGLGEVDYMEELIKEVNDRYEEIEHLLENPLTASLLFKSYDYKNYIPMKKSIFYRQVYDALYESHDLSKGIGFRRKKESALDFDEFFKACCIVGFITYRVGKVEFSRAEMIDHIKEVLIQAPELKFKPAQFLSDMLDSVPFLVREGEDIRWMHKSFQEYFAAQALSEFFRDTSHVTLASILGSKNRKHENVLDFFYEMDTRAYTLQIIKPLIKVYKEREKRTTESGDKIHPDLRRLAESFGFRRFLIYAGKDMRADETDEIVDFNVDAEKLFMLILGGEILIIMETYKEDFFWEIASRKKASYVKIGGDFFKISEDKMGDIKRIIEDNSYIGFSKAPFPSLKEGNVATLESLLKNRSFFKIDLGLAEQEVNNFEKLQDIPKSLFEF
jgi:hypothetical protein